MTASAPIATSPELLDLLEKARAKWEAMTPEQREEMLRQQRRNYVLAEAFFGSDADEAAWQDAYQRDDGETLERLNAASCARRSAAEKWLEENGL